jgi:uncharacterized protein DUF1835
VLHVTNGDCTVDTLARTGLPDDVIAWADVLHDGPVPLVAPDELRAVRARYLAATFDVREEQVLAHLRARDERLARALAEGEPVVLWFEHDLYDQLQVLEVLTAIGARDGIELILVGAFPGHPRFAGLGELTAEELARLWPARTPLRPVQHERAERAWTAFRAGDLAALRAEAAATDDAGLPHLGAALERLLDELPGDDGLPRTERQLLRAVAGGAATAGEAFVAAARMEEAPFLGDASAFWRLTHMARAPSAPLTVDGDPVGRRTPTRITEFGCAILAGDASYIRPPGEQRWLGGARLG